MFIPDSRVLVVPSPKRLHINLNVNIKKNNNNWPVDKSSPDRDFLYKDLVYKDNQDFQGNF